MMRLYLVTDQELLLGKDLFDTVEQAVKGGVTMVQLREKSGNSFDFVHKAIKLKEILKRYNVPLIINDRVDIALASGADGVHIGQRDIPFELVRRIVPKEMIIGLSVESREQVLQANEMTVDYIAASPVFCTSTKTDTTIEWGIEGLRWIKANSGHRIVAIGNMKLENIHQVVDAGADGVAVVSGIISADDPFWAAKQYSDRLF